MDNTQKADVKKMKKEELLSLIEHFFTYSDQITSDDLNELITLHRGSEESRTAFLTVLVRELKNKC